MQTEGIAVIHFMVVNPLLTVPAPDLAQASCLADHTQGSASSRATEEQYIIESPARQSDKPFSYSTCPTSRTLSS